MVKNRGDIFLGHPVFHDHLYRFSIKSKSSFNLQGSESWLVSYDECEALGRQDVIISLHGNKFFSVSVSGIFHVSITYLPVVIQGKPIRVNLHLKYDIIGVIDQLSIY